jgi:hypothetical protein
MTVEHKDWREPPPEAYSRATNPERLRPLHGYALDVLGRLQATYDVTASAAFELLPGGMQPFEHARPPVTLTPTAPAAAPLSVAFTTFPSLLVRAGRWYCTAFPVCGCDACGGSAEEEVWRLDELVGDVLAGHFREEVRLPMFGGARLSHAFGRRAARDGSHTAAWSAISRDLARTLVDGGARRVEWQPWPHRNPQATRRAPAV